MHECMCPQATCRPEGQHFNLADKVHLLLFISLSAERSIDYLSSLHSKSWQRDLVETSEKKTVSSTSFPGPFDQL